jgi:hypothetical protein
MCLYHKYYGIIKTQIFFVRLNKWRLWWVVHRAHMGRNKKLIQNLALKLPADDISWVNQDNTMHPVVYYQATTTAGMRAGASCMTHRHILQDFLIWESSYVTWKKYKLRTRGTENAVPVHEHSLYHLNRFKCTSWIKCGLTELHYQLFWKIMWVIFTIINWLQKPAEEINTASQVTRLQSMN